MNGLLYSGPKEYYYVVLKGQKSGLLSSNEKHALGSMRSNGGGFRKEATKLILPEEFI
jgi:hypothetical protein